MKLILSLTILLALTASAQNQADAIKQRARQLTAQQAEQSRQQQTVEDKRFQKFVPKDPWREINGKTNYAKGDGWVQFEGKVLESQPDGVRIEGWYGMPGSFGSPHMEFFVANFPYKLADGEYLGPLQNLTARESGIHAYRTVLGGSRSLRKLEYGNSCAQPGLPQPSAEQQVAAAAAAAAKRVTQRAAELKRHEDLAANGDAYGQLKMGERYLKGDGVDEDKSKALDLLLKSAAQGNTAAQALLRKITAPPPAAR